jgi:hypothetical protein
LAKGRIITSCLAKKWIESVFVSGVARKVAGEELNEGNREGEFEGAFLRYFPVEEENSGDDPSDMFVNNEKGFVNKIDNAINEWLSSRPPPKRPHSFLSWGRPIVSVGRQ